MTTFLASALGDNRHDCADVSKLQHSFGAKAFTDFEGLTRLVGWAKRVKASDLFEREERQRIKFLKNHHS